MLIAGKFPDVPPLWSAGAAILAWVASEVAPIARFDSPVATGAGIVLIVLGASLIAWAALWFRRKATTIQPGERPTALIVEVPYRINRNPIYTGLTLIVFGVAVLLGAVAALIIAALTPVILDRRFVRGEEAGLRAAFGDDAELYFARTRRW
jgi:protein-S-isoprenylcysteine O-methyltransferase Ste14